jgi:hypothetical protein
VDAFIVGITVETVKLFQAEVELEGNWRELSLSVAFRSSPSPYPIATGEGGSAGGDLAVRVAAGISAL